MVWVAFVTGMTVGTFSGVLLVGLVKDLAIWRSKAIIGEGPTFTEPVATPVTMAPLVPIQLTGGKLQVN